MQTSYLISIIILANCILAGQIDVNNCREINESVVRVTGGSGTISIGVLNGSGAPTDGNNLYNISQFYTDQLEVDGEDYDFSDMSGFRNCRMSIAGNEAGGDVSILLPLDKGEGVEADEMGGYIWRCEFVDSSGFGGRRDLRSLLVI